MSSPAEKLTALQELIKAGLIPVFMGRVLMDFPIQSYVIDCPKCHNHTIDVFANEMSCDEWIIKGIIE